jgi:hypothetical protein
VGVATRLRASTAETECAATVPGPARNKAHKARQGNGLGYTGAVHFLAYSITRGLGLFYDGSGWSGSI